MRKTLAEIAELVEGEVVGNEGVVITGVSGIKEAREGDLTFVANSRYFPLADQTKASAIIAPREFSAKQPTIRTDNPSLAFAKIVSLIVDHHSPSFTGIHQTAVVHESARLGRHVSIGPHTVIEEGVCIGDDTVIYGGCYIGHHTVIGKECLFHANVSIRERTQIGSRVAIHNGSVIGSDGFGYVDVKGIHEKIPQIGIVEIGDDVEIGANVTIDRARFEKTIIGRGTKIDNLVQIAHNVKIGENCILCSQVGISGSCTLENNVIFAGQVGLAGHLTVGEGAVVASRSGVSNSIPPHTTYWGFPAKPHMQAKRVNACVQRLPLYVKSIQQLQKKVEELESRLRAEGQ